MRGLWKLHVAVFSCFFASGAAASPRVDLLVSPLRFEPNAGQIPPGFDFVARGRGYTLLLSAGRAALALRAPDSGRTQVAWRLAGATKAVAEPLDRLPGVASYFRGPNPARWIAGIPTYSRVRYRGIYPGADLVFYGNAGQMEYDFELAPGADPGRIRLEVEGVRRIRLDASGDAVLEVADGELRHRRPVARQSGRNVEARFVLHGARTLGFALGKYDAGKPLTIDPVLSYASFLGGGDDDSAAGIGVDGSGNLYVAGRTESDDFPTVASADFGGDADVFVTKLDPSGRTALYSVLLGGGGDDGANALTVDQAGNAYVAGFTGSSDFPATESAFQSSRAGGRDAFALKLNSLGTQLSFSTFLGGGRDDSASAIAVDRGGNAYIAGETGSSDFPTSPGAFRSSRTGADLDAFVVKLTPDARIGYSTFLGGMFDDRANAIAVDAGGAASVAGATQSLNFPVTVDALRTCPANWDAFYAKLNAGGNALLHATCIGGGGTDEARAIALDPTGAVYVAGSTDSTDFPTSIAALERVCKSDRDGFVAKWAPAGGAPLYSTCFGGTRSDSAFAIAVDPGGGAVVAGQTESNNFPVTSDAFQGARAGDADAFVLKLNPAGSRLVSSSYFGGGRRDSARAVAVGASGGISYVAGLTDSDDFPAGAGAFQPRRAGDSDAFLARVVFGLSPAINAGGIVSAAAFQTGPLAPGGIASLFGTDLAVAAESAGAAPLPTRLGETTVEVDGIAAPLYFVSPLQINFQVPYEVREGASTAVVSAAGVRSAPVSFQVAAGSPSLFFEFGATPPRVLAQTAQGAAINASNPASAGSAVVVYLTGIGPVDNRVTTGAAAPDAPLSRPILQTRATIGGRDAEVLFIGLTPRFVGLAQANLRVPALPPGDHPVAITIGGVTSNTPVLPVR